MKKLMKNQKGFTIIEVMIVLVIAAVILLIVFLAIPALQRNSRNTQRKSDVSKLLAAVNEYSGNAAGQLPATLGDFSANAKLGFYDIASEVVYTASPASVAAPSDGSTTVTIYGKTKCSTTTANAPTLSGASSRQFVAVYNVEVAAGLNQEQCQEG